MATRRDDNVMVFQEDEKQQWVQVGPGILRIVEEEREFEVINGTGEQASKFLLACVCLFALLILL